MEAKPDLASVYRHTHHLRSPPPTAKPDEPVIEANPFLDAFIAIDEDGSETITVEELRNYMKKNNFQESFIKKWLKMFDLNSDGVISLDEFCEVLGLQMKNARMYRRKVQGGLPAEVTVISSSMAEWMQVIIVESVRRASGRFRDERDISNDIKQHLDAEFGKLWQVVIVMGQYFASYSHEPEMSFFFKLGNRVYLIWKTPPP
ncbi:hypothetical protein BOX15_Mlig010884g2 [Macrostomum lignano]|uniref:EF-hand domain-containing protein n=2 Tax=Macrostomum lignano TaxID=282301 RepID=A0A267G611_9PLAT|nr:hypothetical protein BOX15_Mlig010884g3 [Macrostomum lignano]PAA81458.1 hypothetical protein BOX15_Mlig010884g2 [Macrostomum lignano]